MASRRRSTRSFHLRLQRVVVERVGSETKGVGCRGMGRAKEGLRAWVKSVACACAQCTRTDRTQQQQQQKGVNNEPRQVLQLQQTRARGARRGPFYAAVVFSSFFPSLLRRRHRRRVRKKMKKNEKNCQNRTRAGHGPSSSPPPMAGPLGHSDSICEGKRPFLHPCARHVWGLRTRAVAPAGRQRAQKCTSIFFSPSPFPPSPPSPPVRFLPPNRKNKTHFNLPQVYLLPPPASKEFSTKKERTRLGREANL